MFDHAVFVTFIISQILLISFGIWLGSKGKRDLQRTIDRQNDTIQRLIQREPVTYAEVGTQPPKKNKEVYAAWGSQIVNIDEDESRA